jgi:hypothetical protein
MLGRVIGILMVGGGCALGAIMLLHRFTAPSCGAEVTTSKLVGEVSAETGLTSLYLLNAHDLRSGLLAQTRFCEADVAQIYALQPLHDAHWLRVIYSAQINRPTGVVTVRSRIAGPVTPAFRTSPAA